MPQSKKRKSQKHEHIDYIPHAKEKKSTVPLAITVCVVLALGIAWFAAGDSIIGLLTGAAAGAVVGYFAGKEMDKAFSK